MDATSCCVGSVLGHEACRTVLGERGVSLGTDQSIYIGVQFYVYAHTKGSKLAQYKLKSIAGAFGKMHYFSVANLPS